MTGQGNERARLCRQERPSVNRIALAALLVVAAMGPCFTMAGCAGDVDGDHQTPPSEQSAVVEHDGRTAMDDGASGAGSERYRDLTLSDIPADALITVDELQGMLVSQNPPFLVDIRAQGFWIDGHIPEARNIPAGKQLDIRLEEIPDDGTLIVLVPRGEERVAEVWQTLVDAGYEQDAVKALAGGMDAWKEAGLPVQQEVDLGC